MTTLAAMFADELGDAIAGSPTTCARWRSSTYWAASRTAGAARRRPVTKVTHRDRFGGPPLGARPVIDEITITPMDPDHYGVQVTENATSHRGSGSTRLRDSLTLTDVDHETLVRESFLLLDRERRRRSCRSSPSTTSPASSPATTTSCRTTRAVQLSLSRVVRGEAGGLEDEPCGVAGRRPQGRGRRDRRGPPRRRDLRGSGVPLAGRRRHQGRRRRGLPRHHLAAHRWCGGVQARGAPDLHAVVSEDANSRPGRRWSRSAQGRQ